jgi:hypothetical protein
MFSTADSSRAAEPEGRAWAFASYDAAADLGRPSSMVA